MRIFGAFLIVSLLGGCGAGTPEAEAPDAEAETSKDSAAADEGDAADDTGSEAEAEGDAETESDSTESEPKPEAQRLLTQEGTTFLYDFSKSEAGEKAKERCEKASGDNAEKNANCMNKASKAVKPHGFKFERDKSGEGFWFVRFEIAGTKLVEKNRVQADFADDTGSKITIKTQGPDKARGGAKVPASFEIELPDQYTLIIDEPGRGKSVYEPKLGLFDEN